MATTQLMLQLEVEQQLSTDVSRHRCKEIGCTDKEAEAAARGEIHHLPRDAPTRSSFASLPRP